MECAGSKSHDTLKALPEKVIPNPVDERQTPTEIVEIAAATNSDDTTDSRAESKQGLSETIGDADSTQSLPTLPKLPVITPLPPLPSVSSSDPGSMSDMLSAVASIGSDPPSASAAPTLRQDMTETEVDAAIQAEMAELKAEIAALRSSIGDSAGVGYEDQGQEKDGEDNVLHMAQFKLDHVEESMRRL